MYKDRTIYNTLTSHKTNGKITILTGARQVGKTTLMKRLYEQECKDHPALFLDLDIYSHYEQVKTYENFINTLKLNGYQDSQDRLFIVFLDEFQRYADISRTLKSVSDHHPNVKIYASGSSSLAINDQIQESLAGRKRILPVFPLRFSEYLHFVEKDDLITQINHLPDTVSDDLVSLIPQAFAELERFLVFGGYPEVVLAPAAEKKDVLTSIFDLYVKKDLVDFLKIEKVSHAKTLIRHLAVNHGQETSYSHLAQVAGINEKTARNYVDILKETFIVTVHPPWFTNRNKELVKMPKVYFSDNGVRNFFVNNFNPSDMRGDASFLFEGFVISELIKTGCPPDYIKYWRTKNRHEVDIILDNGTRVKPVEIKYKKILRPSDCKGLDRFSSTYPHIQNQYIVNLACNRTKENIKYISPFEISGLISDM